jgi:putative hemolysin
LIDRFVAAALMLAVVVGCASSPVSAPIARDLDSPQQVKTFAIPDTGAAEAYCKSTGGQVQKRKPVFGTNNPSSSQLVLSGSAEFCMWTSKKDGSRIYTLLGTLYATLPTLAALAYYKKPPIPASCGAGGANPASCYCTYLGGSDQFGGANLAGGAWVLKGAVDIDLETCIFPDLSSIDSWGLTYHSHNIVRGINLSKVLRYHYE